ncbi:hypothetical protein AOL_s00006g569 [Orbilia oligospora ATCC 24927]|uniref:Uncharacterized protein n=1 Tax=Arthrobotrys oligospora (strain ATCC 24927 / CBS 115.81 / DSM 1491) TaxID=756982 RepID=G1X118_ARTOA|nr:hypothetical protein AOL_s00006g569 [Orbilia oligospora ATCC 24927]EGX53191.1 hypothetical protein AOL_s00006g569 [Orbilia oligospora ATCC 24927]
MSRKQTSRARRCRCDATSRLTTVWPGLHMYRRPRRGSARRSTFWFPPNVNPFDSALLITGRPHIPFIVDRYFAGVLKTTIEANKSDIEKFVATKIDEDWARDKYLMDEKLKQDILVRITKASRRTREASN